MKLNLNFSIFPVQIYSHFDQRDKIYNSKMLPISDQNNQIPRFWRAQPKSRPPRVAEWLTASPATRSPGTAVGSNPTEGKSFCFLFS